MAGSLPLLGKVIVTLNQDHPFIDAVLVGLCSLLV